MSDRIVKVTLSAQVQSYVQGMKQAAEATRKTGTDAEKLAQKGQAIEKMGRYALVAGGAMAAGLGLSAKAAMDWQSAWTGVTKTVDGTPEQLKAVEDGLRGLTKELPASHEEIAAVAEAAGQLGIQTGNVVDFTKTMIDLGETTNLAAETAATSLARFTNIMGTSQDQVSNLGSALVGLGNNYATTEAEIMEMSMRLAGAGKQIGMTEGDVLGLATALSSVGIEAEAGGSAMSKVMIDIAASVEEGGERLEAFARVAGMTSDQFAKLWKESSSDALAAFVKGLGSAESQGKSTLGILQELGITEVRMRDALLRASSAADQFSDAMAMGNREFEQNNALLEEAQKRYGTAESKMAIMGNKVRDAAIVLGQALLPALELVAGAVGGFADMLGGLEGPMAMVVAWSGVVVAGVLLVGGTALLAVPKIAAFKGAMLTLGVTATGVGTTLRAISSFMLGPWGAAVAAVAILPTAISSVMKGFQATTAELENAATTATSSGELLKTAFQGKLSNGWWIDDGADAIENFQKKLLGAGEIQENWWARFAHGTDGVFDFQNTMADLGKTLAEMSTSNLPAAQNAFKLLSAETDGSRKQLMILLNTMPEYKEALMGIATQQGVVADDAYLLDLALGELDPALAGVADAAGKPAKPLGEIGFAASSSADEIKKLGDELRNFGDGQFDLEETGIRLQEQFRNLAELMRDGASLDITTSNGAETVRALMDMAEAANANAAAIYEMTGDTEAAGAVLADTRQRIIDARVALDDSATEAALWADRFVASGDEVIAKAEEVNAGIDGIKVPQKVLEIDVDAAAAFAGIEGVNITQVDGKTAYVYGDNAEAMAKIDAVAAAQIDGKKVWIGANDQGFQDTWAKIRDTKLTKTIHLFGSVTMDTSSLQMGIRGSTPSNTSFRYGNTANANGNIHAYANGGFGAGIYSGGNPLYKFAEPETGWEAFISGKPGQETRNRRIWSEAGNRLGVADEIGKAVSAALEGLKMGGSSVTVNKTVVNPVVRDGFDDSWDEVNGGHGFNY